MIRTNSIPHPLNNYCF